MNLAAPFKPLTKTDVADVLGVSARTVENWVNDHTLPAPRRLGNRVYWHPAVFYGWLEERLTGDGPVALGLQDAPVGPSAPLPAKAPGAAKPRSTELEQLRSRNEAKLKALLA